MRKFWYALVHAHLITHDVVGIRIVDPEALLIRTSPLRHVPAFGAVEHDHLRFVERYNSLYGALGLEFEGKHAVGTCEKNALSRPLRQPFVRIAFAG